MWKSFKFSRYGFILEGVALVSIALILERALTLNICKKERERQTLAVSHDDGSDNCDRGRIPRSHCGPSLARQLSWCSVSWVWLRPPLIVLGLASVFPNHLGALVRGQRLPLHVPSGGAFPAAPVPWP